MKAILVWDCRRKECAAIEAARAAGHDALIAHKLEDPTGVHGDTAPQTQIAMFHPKDI